MARKRIARASGRTVLVVDDSAEYLQASRSIVERDGHDVLTALSPSEGLAILRARDVDLVVVDYLMPGMTGEDFVREMRAFRPTTQVLLQTGYASEHPPRELLRRLDIQGFHDKSDGPEKLALWVDVGLKAAFTVQLLAKSRMGLRYVLDATPELHRIQPLADLLQGVLLQTAGLLGATHSFLASVPKPLPGEGEGFVAMAHDDDDFVVRAATGRFQVSQHLEDCFDAERVSAARAVLAGRDVSIEGATLAPLRVGHRVLGMIYLDRPMREAWERELVDVFANQAAVAIQNVSLYEMAALDSLTGVFTRRFFEQSVTREIRGASRTRASLGMMIVDVDGMKGINDTHGHVAGDRALEALAGALRQAVRVTDFVGRLGGDEFAVLLPATDAAGVALVAARVREALNGSTITHEGAVIPVRASVGASVLASGTMDPRLLRRGAAEAFEAVASSMYRAADGAMYRQKQQGIPSPPPLVSWPTTDAPAPTHAT